MEGTSTDKLAYIIISGHDCLNKRVFSLVKTQSLLIVFVPQSVCAKRWQWLGMIAYFNHMPMKRIQTYTWIHKHTHKNENKVYTTATVNTQDPVDRHS